jgi:hypothetical protein
VKVNVVTLLRAALAATALGGCVVDPYHGGGYRYGGYHQPYADDDRGYYDDDRYDDHHGGHHKGRDDRPTIVCASKDGRATRCRTDFRITYAEVDKRYSNSPCNYGRDWGYDGNEVWVDRGCRARFKLTPAGRGR